MEILQTSKLTKEQLTCVLKLWNSEYPSQIVYSNGQDFENFIAGMKNARHFTITDDAANVEGWLCIFERNNEDWFSMIVSGASQGKGYGSALLREAKEHIKSLNGWAVDHNRDVKSNGESYKSPLEFYTKNCFEIVSNERLENNGVSTVKILWRSEENK